MSRPATGTISIMPDKKRKGKEGTHRLLATHDELHRTLYRLGVGVLRVHERHGSPRGLYDLRLLMLDPRDDLARLVALAPAVGTLLREEEFARLARRRAGRVGLADQRKRLERKL